MIWVLSSRNGRRAKPGATLSLQQTLHDQQPQPFSELQSRFRKQAHLLKSKRRMQRCGDGVHSTNASHHGVTSPGLALRDQLAEEQFAYAVANAIGPHIDGVFDRKALAFAGTKLRRETKSDDISLEFRN